MKFTNGYWLIRPNFQMQYATQAVRVESAPTRCTCCPPAAPSITGVIRWTAARWM